MKKMITLQEDAHLETGTYRLPTEDGKPSIYVLDGAWYQAFASDQHGAKYMVFWTIREDFDADSGDESDACNWVTPRAIVYLDDDYSPIKDVSAEVQIVF